MLLKLSLLALITNSNANKELCDLCINFVIDCAVKIQDSDYETSKYLVTTHL